jgi:L-lactate dehydrogenase complex protein LldF
MKQYADLPFASTLCGSCSNVCPVKIDIHQQLYKWRQVITEEGYSPKTKTAAMKMMAATLSKPAVFNFAATAGKWVMKYFPFMAGNRLNPWYKQREMPAVPKESFTQWYKKNRHE